ncbi:MAG TPA: phosphopentomutase [Lachnospiraceae bacterium]|uniref:phosphopentomutase n=1 Tax=Anaerosporobacter sp. TaxID=1872529 RepID=UPI000EBDD686|nr:phosphopentomutase [Anaerosporobacter sp.]HAB62436.1 phosphopentomutase [Lachnospiraceae bacterium]
MKRVFLIVLDSFGIGEMPDAANYGDAGSNTVKAASTSQYFRMPNMKKLGFFNIDGVEIERPEEDWAKEEVTPVGAYARMTEMSKGKDTTIGHWEIAGIVSEKPLPTFPDGFPKELLDVFEERTGRKVICNKPYSGTDVIRDYGEEHVKTGALIVYTSADSVFQIAAHESVVPIEQLYEYCEIAREICEGKYGVGRVIARPFEGEAPNFKRTSRRHDYSLVPPNTTMLDQLLEADLDVLAVGKINDIFAGKGIGEMVRTANNAEGIERTLEYMKRDFNGLCFTNLVDFDMLYGHRNDAEGYAKALTYFDEKLPEILAALKEDDLLMITADHGCDPVTPSTDHSREYTPLVIYGDKIKKNTNLGTRESFADIAATILDYFDVDSKVTGKSLLPEIM